MIQSTGRKSTRRTASKLKSAGIIGRYGSFQQAAAANITIDIAWSGFDDALQEDIVSWDSKIVWMKIDLRLEEKHSPYLQCALKLYLLKKMMILALNVNPIEDLA